MGAKCQEILKPILTRINQDFYSMHYQEEKFDFKEGLPLEVFKAIRFHHPYPERFIGHLLYVRDYYKGYDHVAGDVLDKQILASLKNIFENAYFTINDLLLTHQQVDTYQTVTRGGTEKNITFYFMPLADYDTYLELHRAGQLKHYPLPLTATFWLNSSDDKLNYVPSEIRVQVPHIELKSLVKTIKNKVS